MIRKYRLPLQTKGYVETIRLPQYDQSYMLVFDMHGLPEGTTDLEDYTAKMEGTRSDGLKYEYTGTISGASVSFEIDTRMTAAAGNGEARIVFSYASTGEIYASANFQTYIDASPVPDDAAEADTEEARSIAEQIQEIVSTAASQTTAEAERIVAGLEADVDDVKEDLNAVFITDSASGSTARFVDGADNVPMKSVKVALEPIQSGSGDPSPSNVRPISGHSGTVKVYRSGEDTSDASEFSVALNGVVYGGTLDMVSGVLTVDRASVVMDGSTDEGWYVMDTANIFRANAITPKPASGATAEDITQHPALSNRTNVTRYNYNLMKNAYPSISFNADGRLYLAISADTTTIEQATAWLSQNNLQVCYYLDTPQTIQLTGVQIKSLLGINNVWSDSGDVEVEYRADTKLYIDKRLGV